MPFTGWVYLGTVLRRGPSRIRPLPTTMLRLVAAAALACAAALPTPATPAAGPDVDYSETHRFVLGRSGETLREETEVRVRYRTDRSTEQAEFAVWEQYFAPVRELRAWLDDGRLGRDEIREVIPQPADIFLSSGKAHVMTPERAPRVGSVFRYSYEREYLSPAYAPILRVPNIDRIERYSIEVEHPRGVRVGFDVFVPRGTVPFRIDSTQAGRTAIHFEGLGAADELPMFAHNGYHAAVMLDLRDRATGDAITPTRPDEFADWYRALTSAQTGFGEAVRTTARMLRADTDSATVAAIHDHVRGTVRYIADERDAGAFVPRAPDLVLSRSYGDCKDRAFLVQALARALDIPVDVVLISTEPEPEFERAHLFLFNHVINAYTAGSGHRVYFDPTSAHHSFGDLPEGDIDGHALRIGADGEAERVFVPSPDDAPDIEIDIRADLDAPDDATALVTVRGPLLGALRNVEARGTMTDVVNVLSSVAGEQLYKIRLSAIGAADHEGDAWRFVARADLSQFVIASPTKRYLPATPFRAVDADVRERADDALPIYTPARPNVRLALDVVGDGWAAEPERVALGHADGPVRFAREVAAAGGATRVVYDFRQRTRRLLGDDRAAYLDVADAYLGARREVVTFRRPE